MATGIFKAVAGTGDNCRLYKRSQFNDDPKLIELTSLCLAEETPYIILKSHSIRYVFTDLGVIISTRDFAGGKKRTVDRINWVENTVHILGEVNFGTVGSGGDLSCDISFNLQGRKKIDIVREQQNEAMYFYKFLNSLSNFMLETSRREKITMSLAPKFKIKRYACNFDIILAAHFF
jgi:hypothetical protein